MEQSETKPKRKIFEVAEKKEEYTPKKKRPKWIKTNKY